MLLVELCEILGWVRRDVVGSEIRGIGIEGAADYLLDLAGVEVDAGSETCHCCGDCCRNSSGPA